MSATPEQGLTIDEYTAIEESSETKHEFLEGNVYEMTDFSLAHNLIAVNVIGILHQQLRGKSCQIYPSNQRLKVEATGFYTYADASVVCGPAQFADAPKHTMTNPTVLIEILSPSTESYDRGKKFQHYRKMESLRAYLLIAQDSMHVELYTRQEQNRWLLVEFTEQDAMVPLDAIGCTLAVKDIYEDVEFDG
ncbi:MAG: Uma2 family endonuclease [Armatimonadota bacterium]